MGPYFERLDALRSHRQFHPEPIIEAEQQFNARLETTLKQTRTQLLELQSRDQLTEHTITVKNPFGIDINPNFLGKGITFSGPDGMYTNAFVGMEMPFGRSKVMRAISRFMKNHDSILIALEGFDKNNSPLDHEYYYLWHGNDGAEAYFETSFIPQRSMAWMEDQRRLETIQETIAQVLPPPHLA